MPKPKPRRQKSTDGTPVVCSASCCPKHPKHGTGSCMAVPVDCKVAKPGKLGVCRESEVA